MPEYDVFLFGKPVGVISRTTGAYTFQYRSEVVENDAVRPISRSLPKREEPYDQEEADPFFQGLLPEEEYKELVARGVNVSAGNTPGLLGAIGGECAGAVSIWPQGEAPLAKGRYRALSTTDLEQIFEEGKLPDAVREGRLSLGGAQSKIVAHRRDGTWHLPLKGSPSLYILKRTVHPGCPDLVQNEYFCLSLAERLGLPVPEARVEVFGSVSVVAVRRYDRIEEGESIRRMHQEDLCQALGYPPDRKYESDGGASFAQIAEVIREECSVPLQDLRRLIRWAGFNYLIGNCDAHSKNVALLYDPEETRLSPFYDLNSTWVCNGLSRNGAMRIGGKYEQGYLESRHWERFADDLAVPQRAVSDELQSLAERGQEVVTDVRREVEAATGNSAKIEAIEALVSARSEKLMESW